MMKKIIALILVLAITPLCFSAFALPRKQQDFTDLNNHWSRSVVLRLIDYGIINGYADGTFRPNNIINADEFLKLIISAIGYNSKNTESGYWAQGYIDSAKELSMIDDGEYTTFNNGIAREKIAKIVSYALKNPPVGDLSAHKAAISDYADVTEGYKEYVLTAYDSRIITGYDGDYFCPLSDITRAEAAVIITRLIDKNGGIAVNTPDNGAANGNQDSSVGAAAAKLYVAENGNDGNDGSEARPFKTIAKAKETIRSYNGNIPTGGITVYIRGGTYYMYDSLEFTEADSGKDNAKITYSAYPGERVRLSGGVPLEKSWFKPADNQAKARLIEKSAQNKLLVADLKANGVTEYGVLNTRGYHIFNKGQYMAAELIVDGENQTLARYPNSGTMTVKDSNLMPEDTAFKYDDSRPTLWAKAEDPWFVGTVSINYENNAYPIKKIDTTSKTIYLKEGKVRSYYTNGFFFGENLLEEIDAVGEYYIDRQNGVLYYYPSDDFMTGNHTIELSTLAKPMFHFEGAKNVTVSGITMDAGRGYAAVGNTAGYKMMTYGDFLAKNNVTNPATFDPTSKATTKLAAPDNYPEAQVFPGHIWDGFLDDGEGVNGIEFKNCEIRNFGQGGLIFRGLNVKFNNNHIKNIGGTGIFLTGGNFDTLESSGNEIKNNIIHRVGYQHRAYNPAIAIQGVGCHVAYNDVYDAPHCIVNYHGNDHIIEYNKIHDAVKECLDMDAIYTRNEYIPQWRGTVVRNNYIYNLGIFPIGEYTKQLNISGIRTDNSGHALQIYNNIFANIGTSGANSVIAITAQGNRNTIKGNLFVDCAEIYWGANAYNPGGNWDISKAEVKERLELAKKYSEIPLYAEKYPELKTFDKEFYASVKTNIFSSNLVVNLKFKLSETNGTPNADGTRGAPELIISNDNHVTTQNPGFADYGAGNYELTDGSETLSKLPDYKNFKMTDFGPNEKVGPN